MCLIAHFTGSTISQVINQSESAAAGDEYAQTRNGNNNWYGHDNQMTRFNWDKLEEVRDSFFRFYRYFFQPALGVVSVCMQVVPG